VFLCFSSTGYEQYLYWRRRSLEHLPLPHVTIFLDASPQCCFERIRTRARVSKKYKFTMIFFLVLYATWALAGQGEPDDPLPLIYCLVCRIVKRAVLPWTIFKNFIKNT
jgi:hypothetical protein